MTTGYIKMDTISDHVEFIEYLDCSERELIIALLSCSPPLPVAMSALFNVAKLREMYFQNGKRSFESTDETSEYRESESKFGYDLFCLKKNLEKTIENLYKNYS